MALAIFTQRFNLKEEVKPGKYIKKQRILKNPDFIWKSIEF